MDYRPEPAVSLSQVPETRPSERGSVRRGCTLVLTHDATATDAIATDLANGAIGVRIRAHGDEALLQALRAATGASLVEIASGSAAVLDLLTEHLAALPTLDLGLDPIGAWARTGHSGLAIETDLEAAAAVAVRCDADHPAARAFTLDGTVWHDAGSTQATAIGALAANAVAVLRVLEARGLPVDRAFAQLAVRQAVGGRFLLGVAALRATRRVLARVAHACGTSWHPTQTAVAADREQATRDPWVNILRGTAAGFAAFVGGAERLDLPPFADTDTARRLARNTALVLDQEGRLGAVADPGGGAPAIEQMTAQLAEGAWAELQRIEAEGGLVASLRSGALQERIAAEREALADAVASGAHPLLGVSKFPNPDEDAPPPVPRGVPPATASGEISPLAPVRLQDFTAKVNR